MRKQHTIKRILIIGGMGPQASIYAHSRLQELLLENNKCAEIVHLSLVIEHFFDSKPALNLTDRQIALLNSIDADTGFIACNTAHLFFNDISDMVNFKLVSMLDFSIDTESVMLCSPTSKEFKVFGSKASYLPEDLDRIAGEVITLVNKGDERGAIDKFKDLTASLPRDQIIASCTELSMLANKLKLGTRCTLEDSLLKIVRNL